jgi:predicted Rdx family selenoprotein
MRLRSFCSIYSFGHKATWYNAELHKPSFGELQKVTLIPGIGIGPEITS